VTAHRLGLFARRDFIGPGELALDVLGRLDCGFDDGRKTAIPLACLAYTTPWDTIGGKVKMALRWSLMIR